MAVLFLSRATRSGVQALTDCLHERTGLEVISREDLVRLVGRHGDWATSVVAEISHASSQYDRFSRIRRPYIVLMRQALLERIHGDNVVYHGISGHLLLPRLGHFVRVRICEPLRTQIAMTREELRCDEEHAKESLRETENLEVRWARFMYGRDVRDPTLYDLNLNLGHLTMEVACGILEHLLWERELQSSPEARAEVERLLTMANVEAALVTDERTRALEVDCRIEQGKTRLDGPYLEGDLREVVMEVARRAAPPEPIAYEPGYAAVQWVEDRACD